MINAMVKNPILVKEIRTRMRGNRAFLLVTLHLLIQSLLVGLVFLLFQSNSSSLSSFENRRTYSKVVFSILVLFELVMISFIAPALSAGAFSTERERHTYDLLRATPLSARSLVFGKYTSALSFLFLLLFTSLPMLSPAFMIGGVTSIELLISLAVLSIGAITLCAIGLFFSSLFSRTLLTNILTYSWAVFFTFGIPILLLTVLVILQSGNTERIAHLSSVTLVFWALIGWIAVAISPLATLISAEYLFLEQNNIWVVKLVLSENMTIHLLSPWIGHVFLYSLLSIGLVWITIQRVKQIDTQ